MLEGPSDDKTASTFRDIAETVQDGLHGLGHPSRVVYCTNIAVDTCVDDGGKVIVLAAHNLASFLTAEGDSAVLKLELLPSDAGERHGCTYTAALSAVKKVFENGQPGSSFIAVSSIIESCQGKTVKVLLLPQNKRNQVHNDLDTVSLPLFTAVRCSYVGEFPSEFFLSDVSVPVCVHGLFSPFLLPVLYNFEQVPRDGFREPSMRSIAQDGGRDRSLVSPRTLQIYARYKMWDYSEENVKNLADMGIRADLVPLGYSSKLESSSRYADGTNQMAETENIDVLFIGMETPTRQATIRRLREAGVAVVHPNSAGIDLYGAENDAIAAKSKIVLSLNAFGDTAAGECSSSGSISNNRDSDPRCSNGEWKMPRLARLMANGR